MNRFLLAFALVLALAGCGKYEVYERNLQYMTMDTFQAEKAIVVQRYHEAEAKLSRAQASGNQESIKAATEEFKDAQKQMRTVDAEERRRTRPAYSSSGGTAM